MTVPVRPEVKLGDYAGFPFAPEIEEVNDEQVDGSSSSCATSRPASCRSRTAAPQKGDFAVIRFVGRRDGEPSRAPRRSGCRWSSAASVWCPGFEAALVGMREDEEKTFTVTFPEDYREAELAGQPVEFTATLRELRERRPAAAGRRLRPVGRRVRGPGRAARGHPERLQRSALDRARHVFADRIIEYAVANATVDAARPAGRARGRRHDRRAQGPARRSRNIGYEEYLKVTERDEAKLREESREGAEHRVKVLLVLGAIADKEGVEIADAAVEAELERGPAAPSRRAIAGSPSTSSRRAAGRTYARPCAGRRSSRAHRSLDRAASRGSPSVQHVEDQPGSGHGRHVDGRPADRSAEAIAEEAALEARAELDASASASGSRPLAGTDGSGYR